MSSDKEKQAAKSNDKELDDLLDSVLEDFDKTKDATVPVPTAGEDLLPNDEMMQQAKLLEQHMASLFGTTAEDGSMPNAEQFSLGLQKIAEATSMAMSGEGMETVEPQFVDSITQAIQGLREGTDNLNASMPPADLAGMFSGLQMNDEGGDNPFLPFVQGMMQSLLSAEVLLPSLKELLEKYPVWLAENGDKIDPADKERYMKQQELFKVICADLEQEKPNDSADVKSERFKKVLDNMKKLHDYGQPPAELVDAGVDMPQLPPMGDPSSQCPMM